MKILITGGAGFIGSHLAERLEGQGHSVLIYDNFGFSAERWNNGIPVNLSGIRRGTIVHGDCRDEKLEQWAEGCDFIYHLASTVGVKRVLGNPKEAIENNIESLRAVLSLGIPGLFTSTSEVYGRNESVLSEDSEIMYSSKARWSYAASKLIGEWLAKQAGWKTVRLFNVVGPRQSTEYGAVLPTFVRQALNGYPLTIYGDGSQVRTFIDVRDCVEILDRLRDKDFDLVNVGGTHTLSIRDLAIKVWNTVNDEWPIPLATESYGQAYPAGFEECPSRIPDLTKLDSLLPERPSTDFSKTIRDLADSLKPTLEDQKCPVQTT